MLRASAWSRARRGVPRVRSRTKQTMVYPSRVIDLSAHESCGTRRKYLACPWHFLALYLHTKHRKRTSGEWERLNG